MMWNCSEKFYLEKKKYSTRNISLMSKCQLIMMQMSIGVFPDMDPLYYGPVNLTQTQNVYYIFIVSCGSII